MLTAALAWASARRLPLAAFAAMAAFGAIQTARIDGLQTKNAKLGLELAQATEAARLSEQLRGQEQAQDQGSYADQSARCEQRVITAIDAARAIEEITNANASPVIADRPIVPAIELRRIIGQTGRGAAGVPTGSNRTAKP